VHVNNSVNWHWTTAFGAIEGEEPTLATKRATQDAESSRVENTKSCAVVHLLKKTILEKKTVV